MFIVTDMQERCHKEITSALNCHNTDTEEIIKMTQQQKQRMLNPHTHIHTHALITNVNHTCGAEIK